LSSGVTPLRETALSPRLVVLTLGGDDVSSSYGANCVAAAGSRGTLLVDPLVAPAHARLVAAALARRAFPPVTHVVLTHHHTDHALGASWFAARGAEVVAQRRCAEAMAAFHPALVAARRADPDLAALFADAEPHAPTAVFDEGWRGDLGDLPVEVRRAGPAHTPGDALVLLPSEATVACGDLVSSGYHFNYEDAEPGALAGALAELAALPADHFVPGHGPPGGREVVEAQARYHEEVARIVAASATADEARAGIRARCPGFLLEAAIETALARWGVRQGPG
jgi:cyclase